MDNRIMPYDDWVFIGEFINKSNWRFAKTYATTHPHYYTVKKDCNITDYTRFYRLVRRYGYYYDFYGKEYIQLNVNENYYWTMGWPSSESEVINRKERKIDVKTPFDTVPDWTEEVRGNELDRMNIANMIKKHDLEGKVLEIGCGSGLMTQRLDFCREGYLGVDPSWIMLEAFKKSQNLNVCHTDFESLNTGQRFDFVFAACGSASYVRPEYWDRLTDMLNGSYLLAFYTSGYAKPIEKMWKAGAVHFYADDIPELAGERNRTEIGEYTIIDGAIYE